MTVGLFQQGLPDLLQDEVRQPGETQPDQLQRVLRVPPALYDQSPEEGEEKNKGLVINYGEGGGGWLQNGEFPGPKLFVPHPSRQCKAFCIALLKGGNVLRPPSIWLKLQATA